jgi:hypothetical protein
LSKGKNQAEFGHALTQDLSKQLGQSSKDIYSYFSLIFYLLKVIFVNNILIHDNECTYVKKLFRIALNIPKMSVIYDFSSLYQDSIYQTAELEEKRMRTD